MRKRVWCFLLGLEVAVSLAVATPLSWAIEVRDEREQVAAVARNYLESWYAADPERMGRALHSAMVKRYIKTLLTGQQVVSSLTRDQMVEMTRAGGGSKVPPESRKIEAEVLEVSGDIAVARASSAEYVEYLSLARCNGQWVVVNILWRHKASGPGSE